jgi:predicted ATPase
MGLMDIMIQHLKIDSPPLIKSQCLLNLGRVNILTGRNSSGKSTILKKVLEKPDLGKTHQNLEDTRELFRKSIPRHIYEDYHPYIPNIVETILARLDGMYIFNSSQDDVNKLIHKVIKDYSLNINYDQFAGPIIYALTTTAIKSTKPVLLSPKRRMLYEAGIDASGPLDTEAVNALSRLFYLQNQVPDSNDKNVFNRIHKSFSDITNYEFSIQIGVGNNSSMIQLQLRRIGGQWMNGQSEGLGLAEILTLLLYSLDGKQELLLIEEPENHIHPDLQRKLLLFLNSVENRQFVISTHSPIFLNPTMVDRIYFCKYKDGNITIDDNTSRAEALSDLGVLAIDNLTSDAIIISEGKTDQIVLNYIILKWLNAPNNASISHVFLAGSMMKHFDPTPFSEVRNTFALLDCDPENKSAQKSFISACNNSGIIPVQLERYSLESYYTLNAIRKTFGDIVASKIDSIDHMIPLWRQLVDETHNENWWKGELKSIRRIPTLLNNMSIDDIEGTDLLEFCKKIKSVL